MENFILYEQLSKSDSCILYKGRKKNTVNFLAIRCADKSKKGEIANMVRLIRKIKHENIVQFYEWYETAGHLWLIFELCTGGSLDLLIQQDVNLPLESIREFGIDLVEGLYHIHSLDIIYSDLQPSKILVSGTGHLKLSDFGFSRLENEDLDGVLSSFFDAELTPEKFEDKKLEEQIFLFSDVPDELKTSGNPRYMAPEVINGGRHSFASDLWSFGCILYEMFAGHPPYLDENFKNLKEKLTNLDLPQPRSPHGFPSDQFMDLLQKLLQKDPHARMKWLQLLEHPFWEGRLAHHLQTVACSPLPPETPSDRPGDYLKQSIRQSIVNFKVFKEFEKKCDSDDDDDDDEGHERNDDRSDGDRTLDEEDTLKESTSRMKKGVEEKEEGEENSSNLPSSAEPNVGQCGHEGEKSTERALVRRSEVEEPECLDVFALIFHASDFQITPIANQKKGWTKISSLKFDAKALPMTPLDVHAANKEQMADHLRIVTNSLVSSINCRGTTLPQKLLQLLNYVASIAHKNPQISNQLISLKILSHLAKHSKDMTQVEMKYKLCQVLNCIVTSATKLTPETDLSEALSSLVDAAREHSNNRKLKSSYLCALGEILCLINSQEHELRSLGVAWPTPPTVYSFINRCLAEGEDLISNLHAARIIANVAVFEGHHTQVDPIF